MKHPEFLAPFYQEALAHFSLYTWQDGIELLIVTAIVYSFLKWLSKDPGKQPAVFFIGYAALNACTYYAGLSVVSTLMLIATPTILVLAIIMHQHTLQKNVIAHKHINPNNDHLYDWLDELMRALLSALNKQKEIICVIERSDCLKDFLTAGCSLNADLKKQVLEMFFDHLDDTRMVWVHKSGKIVAINANLSISSDPEWMTNDVRQMQSWKQDALFITNKTDAIILSTSSHTRNFECIIDGKDIKDLTASHAITFLRRIFETNTPKQGDGYFHATRYNRSFGKQELS